MHPKAGENVSRICYLFGLLVLLAILSACSDGWEAPPNLGVEVTPEVTTFSENQGEGSFSVRLKEAPGGSVGVRVASSDTTEATVDRESLVFNAENWSSPQKVIITGVDDDLPDGNQNININLGVDSQGTTDGNYSGFPDSAVPDVPVTVVDDDEVGVTVVQAAPISLSESGSSATISVRLNTSPDGEVVIALSNGDPGEVAVDPQQLVFTQNLWSEFQDVTLVGVDDAVADGQQQVLIRLAVDAASTTDKTGYAELDPGAVDDVQVTVADDDAIGVTVASALTSLDEGTGSGSFTVLLNTLPNGNVVIDLSSSDTTEAVVNPQRLTFTQDNWDQPQVVDVAAMPDDVRDQDQLVTITVDVNPEAGLTDDTSGYAALAPEQVADVEVLIIDVDSLGVVVEPGSLTVSEAGKSPTVPQSQNITVRLNSKPAGNVGVVLTSGDAGEIELDKTRLIFSPEDWSTAQTVRVKGVQDFLLDGDQPVEVLVEIDPDPLVTTDTGVNGYIELAAEPVARVEALVLDEDEIGVLVDPTELKISEAGKSRTIPRSGSFAVRLTSIPSGNVSLNIASSHASEATVSPEVLVFDEGNWNQSQFVTVSGVEDDTQDEIPPVTVSLMVDQGRTEDTTGYADLEADAIETVAVTVVNEDFAGVDVYPVSLDLAVGARGIFNVLLKTKPLGQVVVAVSSLDDAEVSVVGTESSEGRPARKLTFTAENWDQDQVVTLERLAAPAGGQPVVIDVRVDGSTTDPNYGGLNESLVPNVGVNYVP